MNAPTDGYAIYDAWNPTHADTNARLDKIKALGFSVVINYDLLFSHITPIINYITYAHSIGLKIAVALHDPAIWKTATYPTVYSLLYADAGNPGTGIAFMQYIVNQVKNLAGTGYYYVGDEVAAGDHATLKTYTDAIHTADSTHPRLLIEIAGSANAFSNGTTAMWDCCDIGGDDFYSIDALNPSPILSAYAKQAAGIQDFCNLKNLDSAMVLQAHSLANYGSIGAPWPTETQMNQMRTTVLSNMTPRLLIFYSYFDAISATAPIWQAQNIGAAISGRAAIAWFPTATRRGSLNSTVNYAATVLADSPYAYYRFSQYDETSNHYDGVIHGTVTAGNPGIGTTPNDPSLLFDGSTGYITLPTATNGLGLSALTVEAWVNFTSLNWTPQGGFVNIIAAGANSLTRGFVLFFQSPNIVAFTLWNSTPASVNITFPLSGIQIGVWYHIVAVYDGTKVWMFLNGVSQKTPIAFTGTVGNSSGQVVVIGASQSGVVSFFPGSISQLALYSSALIGNPDPASKIMNHYRAGTLAQQQNVALFPTATRRGL